ncbi:hypothetical protein [Nostoc sp.]|uniref:hypothetical protein n=1 Tax=Nostoc sp. TaxID=1180 RepID=UPI002FFABFDD
MLYTVAASESIAGSRTAKIAAFSLSLPAIADFDGSKKDNHQESLPNKAKVKRQKKEKEKWL